MYKSCCIVHKLGWNVSFLVHGSTFSNVAYNTYHIFGLFFKHMKFYETDFVFFLYTRILLILSVIPYAPRPLSPKVENKNEKFYNTYCKLFNYFFILLGFWTLFAYISHLKHITWVVFSLSISLSLSLYLSLSLKDQ